MTEVRDHWLGGEAARVRCDRMLAMAFMPPPYWFWLFDTTGLDNFRDIGGAITPHLQADTDIAAYSIPLGTIGCTTRTTLTPVLPLQQISELAGRCVVVVTAQADWPGAARFTETIPAWTTQKIALRAPIAAATTIATVHRLLSEFKVESDIRVDIDSLIEDFEQVADSDNIQVGVDRGSRIAEEALNRRRPDDVPAALRTKLIELAREWTKSQF